MTNQATNDRPLRFLSIPHLEAIVFLVDACGWLPEKKDLYQSIFELDKEARNELKIRKDEIQGE